MNQSKIFSELDVKWAYHQIELGPESRDITTFATREGLPEINVRSKLCSRDAPENNATNLGRT